MAKFERQLNARVSELIRFLDDSLLFDDAELIDSAGQRLNGMNIYLYFYNTGRSALTLQIVGTDSGIVNVSAISSDADPVSRVEALLDRFSPTKTVKE